METIYTVKLTKHSDCIECDGNGFIVHTEGDSNFGILPLAKLQCSDCLGAGRVTEEEEVPLGVLSMLIEQLKRPSTTHDFECYEAHSKGRLCKHGEL